MLSPVSSENVRAADDDEMLLPIMFCVAVGMDEVQGTRENQRRATATLNFSIISF